MEVEKIIKMLTKIETILGVNRNYPAISKTRKILFEIRIIFEVLYIIGFIYTYRTKIKFKDGQFYLMEIFHLANYLSGPIIMINGILTSQQYKRYLENFIPVHAYYIKESKYAEKMKKIKTIFIIVTSISFAISCAGFLVKYYNRYVQNQEITFLVTIFLLSALLVHYRFMLENGVMFTHMVMLRNLLKCLNDCILEAQVYYSNNLSGRSNSSEWRPLLSEEEVQLWASQYMSLLNCSKNLSVCFRTQMFYTLALSSLHYIAGTCGFFYVNLFNGKIVGSSMIVVLMAFTMCCTFFVTRAGQNIFNEGCTTKRRLTKLYSILSINPLASQTKSIQKLCVLVKINPIQIEYNSKTKLGMYLIPIILTLSISYIITALQINNLI